MVWNILSSRGRRSKMHTYSEACGGKGLNQSIAAARSGAEVHHAGAVGSDGTTLLEISRISGVHTGKTKILSGASGHAVIQVDKNGQNNIIICGGANDAVSMGMIDDALREISEGDIVLLQNEYFQCGICRGAGEESRGKDCPESITNQ